MMKKISILDCTLRDGGYVNNWNFGEETIRAITSKLAEAKIEIIECGFLTQKTVWQKEKSIFNTIGQINGHLAAELRESSLACMINYGEYPIDAIPTYNHSGVDTIRVAFHKKDLRECIEYCKAVDKKGYKTYVQPMVTGSYSAEELQILIDGVNSFNPHALYIVDSFGTMRKHEMLTLFHLLDKALAKEIVLGFHSHNNLQLSFSNAQELIAAESEREIIIDSSVFGMGRGAGNLCTELITLHLNENCEKSYESIPILEIVDDYINPIFIKLPWGYSVPYYIASANNCHPNYASYLVEKQTLSVKAINAILSLVAADKKQLYDEKLIESLYIQHQEQSVNDTESRAILKQKLTNRELLILAPGKSLTAHRHTIREYIAKHNPVIWTINFISSEYKADLLFINNMKRFPSMATLKEKLRGETVVVTSNIAQADADFMRVDYISYINPAYHEMDNAGIMLLRLLKSIGQKRVAIAGYDGFDQNPHDNYCSEEMMKMTSMETIQKRNESIRMQVTELKKSLELEFLTPSKYVESV